MLSSQDVHILSVAASTGILANSLGTIHELFFSAGSLILLSGRGGDMFCATATDTITALCCSFPLASLYSSSILPIISKPVAVKRVSG